METNNKETRTIGSISRRSEESQTVEGYALVFNTVSNDLGGFIEKIDRDALLGVIEKSDVLCLLNHDTSKGVLARSRRGVGSLTLKIDDKGLLYSFEIPKTALGEELKEGLRRGDITESSFSFTVEEDEWGQTTDGKTLRIIKKISRLYDVSPVYFPAYNGTFVNERYKSYRDAEKAKEEEKKKQTEEAKRKAVEEYYKNLEN